MVQALIFLKLIDLYRSGCLLSKLRSFYSSPIDQLQSVRKTYDYKSYTCCPVTLWFS